MASSSGMHGSPTKATTASDSTPLDGRTRPAAAGSAELDAETEAMLAAAAKRIEVLEDEKVRCRKREHTKPTQGGRIPLDSLWRTRQQCLHAHRLARSPRWRL